MIDELLEAYVDGELKKMLENFVTTMRGEVIALAETVAKKDGRLTPNKLDIQFALMTLGMCMKEELKERQNEEHNPA